jgi:hypothetical protein
VELLKTQPRLTGIIYRNANAEAVEMLRQNPDNINWFNLSINPSIFEIDYEALKHRISAFKEELVMVGSSKRIQRLLELGGGYRRHRPLLVIKIIQNTYTVETFLFIYKIDFLLFDASTIVRRYKTQYDR